MKNWILICSLITTFFVSGCATGPNSHDPFEPVNRKIYQFNETLDQIVVRPIGKAYTSFVPSLVRTGVRNIFTNLGVINTTFNELLQLKIRNVPVGVARFTSNLILGVGGIFDVASEMGIPYYNEDFGQTLGYWGIDSGPYIVLPLLGPSSVRDSISKPFDFYFDPVTHISDDSTKWNITGLKIIDARSQYLSSEDMLSNSALDQYSFVRDTWLQRREYQIRDGAPKQNESSKYTSKSFRELELELDLD
ncbi:VacJ family lipoprotein [Burkholderiales bacterium]|nr:VacJ family lipoprotein [Burkholderiales bacterium]